MTRLRGRIRILTPCVASLVLSFSDEYSPLMDQSIAVSAWLGFSFAHEGLKTFLLTHSQSYTLHLRPDMARVSESLQRHFARSGYPARIELNAEPDRRADRLRVDVMNPRKDFPNEPRLVSGFFDPARLCDVVLRVLPPAVLDHRSTYPRWSSPRKRVYDLVKRLLLDIVVGILLLGASLPFMAFAAIGILVSDGGPVLFRQTRVGREGKRFSLLKFRTLRAPSSAGYEKPNEGIEDLVFPFGAFLRRTRLDELLQFFNVIRGDMSLIGPRPEMEYFHEKWVEAIPFYEKRLLVRPGLYRLGPGEVPPHDERG